MNQNSFIKSGCLLFVLLLLNFSLKSQTSLSKANTKIHTSTVIKKGEYQISVTKSGESIIVVTGNNIVIDFNNATLSGTKKSSQPDEFTGVGIHIKDSRNITIKNANVKGYRQAILAENVKGLIIENCDLSYNYRPLLKSQREYEDYSDWLSYHKNDNGEWKSFGCGIFMDHCDSAEIKNIKIIQGFNGIMLSNCNGGLIYNSTITYNSGVGIAMYRSSNNRIMHNKLDWNVRGHSHGYYKRGQDSAGILVYEQSNNNIFAYNSATHCGDGFFLWAGQSTLDSGQGGSNDNMLYANDFSFAPTNGIELTFSRNVVFNNFIAGCENGIWGGYSYNTLIFANRFMANNRDIAIEHGQDNSIRMNLFNSSKVGIELWQNKEKPNWPYAKLKNVNSTKYDIERNRFENVSTPFAIHSSSDVSISYNLVIAAKELLHEAFENSNLSFKNNDIRSADSWGNAEKFKDQNSITIKSENSTTPKEYASRITAPTPIPGGYIKDQKIPELHGTEDIIINKWGPYNFEYPYLYLEGKKNNEYSFKIYGPKGNWKIRSIRGLTLEPIKDNISPLSFKAKSDLSAKFEDVNLLLEWTGEPFIDQFGNLNKAGEPYLIKYAAYNPNLKWNVSWSAIPKSMNVANSEIALALLKNPPTCKDTVETLRYAWWSPPCKELNSDNYLTKAETYTSFEPGQYTIYITSDDGVIIYIDGKEIFKNWNIHEPMTDKINLHLEGGHAIKIIHFNGGGFGNLSWRIERN